MPSSVFNENAVFISAVMLINSAHVSGFIISPDDLLDLARPNPCSTKLLLPVKLASKAATFAACAAAAAAASASASAASNSACL